MDSLKNIVDDSTTVVHIPTPEGWKCDRKGCTTDFKHTHGTYSSLTQADISEEATLDEETLLYGANLMMEDPGANNICEGCE